MASLFLFMNDQDKTFKKIDAHYAHCFQEAAKEYVEYLKRKGELQKLLHDYGHFSEDQHLQYVELISALIFDGHYERMMAKTRTAKEIAKEFGAKEEAIRKLKEDEFLSPYNMNDDAFFHTELVDLQDLVKKGRYLEVAGKDKFTIASIAVDTYCHQVTAFLWALYPTRYEIWTGITDNTNCHSWLRDKESGEWLEPTNIQRETYFGYQVPNPAHFLEAEFQLILSMFDIGFLDEKYKDQFTANYYRLIK